MNAEMSSLLGYVHTTVFDAFISTSDSFEWEKFLLKKKKSSDTSLLDMEFVWIPRQTAEARVSPIEMGLIHL